MRDMARNDSEQLSERIGDHGFVEGGVAHAGANRKRFPIARKLVELGDAVDVHKVCRFCEAKRHDGDEALPARQNTAIFRCHLGQRLQRLIERLRHMVNEGRGFHAANASGRGANYLYTNDKPGPRIVKRLGSKAINSAVFRSFHCGRHFPILFGKTNAPVLGG